jgi:hypothetical protein
MTIRFGLCSKILVAVVALLCFQAEKAQAHPALVGTWVATAPPNLHIAYQFAPGVYIGNDTWRGTYTFIVGGQPICSGDYELRIFYGTQATVNLRDGFLAAWQAANVDLGTRVMIYKGELYRP